MSVLFWIFVGMMIGWCGLPQPAWAQPLYDKAVTVICAKISKATESK